MENRTQNQQVHPNCPPSPTGSLPARPAGPALALISADPSSSWLMVTVRERPRDFMMKGMLVPLPEPGAPLSHTTSRGQT